MFPVIENEVLNRIPGKAHQDFARRGTKATVQAAQAAMARWKGLRARSDLLDPPATSDDVQRAYQLFEANQRDLSALVSRPKERIPGPNDLRILAQAARLDRPVALLARDAHFVGYGDLIRSSFGLDIIDVLALPELIPTWRHRGAMD